MHHHDDHELMMLYIAGSKEFEKGLGSFRCSWKRNIYLTSLSDVRIHFINTIKRERESHQTWWGNCGSHSTSSTHGVALEFEFARQVWPLLFLQLQLLHVFFNPFPFFYFILFFNFYIYHGYKIHVSIASTIL